MFTGIVETLGKITRIDSIDGGIRIHVLAPFVMDDLKIGDSISLNGACQTVVALFDGGFAVEAVGETLEKTTLGEFKTGDQLNLERPLTASSRVGGHFVQGHINATAEVTAWDQRGENYFLEVALPDDLIRYVILEGSICIDGISLTVARLQDSRIGINIIPHTAKVTNLQFKSTGSHVNIEVDMMAKYIENFMARRSKSLQPSQ